MSETWAQLKARLLVERGYVCECCHIPNTHLDLHHCLFHRSKKLPCLDDERNCALVCADCHAGPANGYLFRREFWDRQMLRYDMVAWIDSLPMRVKKF